MAVEHPAHEVRHEVFPPRSVALELRQQIDVEFPFLFGACELRVLVDPSEVRLERADLLLTQGLEFLEEIDAPSRETDHLVTGGLVGKGRAVDEAVQVVRVCQCHLRGYIISKESEAHKVKWHK